MKLGSFYGTGYINEGGPLRGHLKVTQERIDISTAGPKPDRLWAFVDSNSHFHARSGDAYPTLRSKDVPQPCDGSCGGVCEGEGYSITEWSCILCGEQVFPGMVPGPHFASMPGLYDWSALLEGDSTRELERLAGTLSERVMLRFEAAHPEPWLFFGAAVIGDVSLSSGFGDRPQVSLHLYAAGELGDRPCMPQKVKAA